MIISSHGLMAQDDSFPNDGLLENTVDLDRFQAYVDSIDKYLYLNTDTVDMYFASCKHILQQNIPVADSSLFDYAIQEIYYAHAKDNALAAFQIIKANEHWLELEEIPQRLKNTFTYMKGFTLMALGDLASAQKIYYKIIDQGERQRDTSLLLQGLYSLGQLLSDEGDFDDAIDYFNRILSFNDSNISAGTRSLVNLELSDIYNRSKQPKKALKLLDSTLVFLEKEEIMVLKPDFLLLKGEMALEAKDHQLAWELYEEANELAHKNQDPINIRKSALVKAQILSSEGNYAEALDIYESMIEQHDTSDLDRSLDLYSHAHTLYKKSGQYTKAYNCLLQINAIQTRIYDKKKGQNTAYLKLEHESEKKENENRILAIQVDQKISQNRLLYALIALFGLGILILFGAFYQKRRFNRKLKAEVSNQTLKLEQANTKLINTNHELDEFNRILSHDLKEPIRSLVGFSTLLKKRGVQSQEAEEYLGYIEQSGKQLYETLSAVSAFQNTVPQEMSVSASIDFAELSENIIENKQRENPDRKIKFSSVDLPIIHTCRSAIHAIFEELIDNAVRFNESEVPEIKIRYAERAGSHCFEFEDNGIGIAPQFHEQVFGMFKRLNRRNKYGGAGLGLNVALKMARRLDGDITIIRSEEGKGSIFQLTFPIDS